MDIFTAKTTLDYPLYACDFDPADPTRLLVGGGGGASRTGVGNKITLLNASEPQDPNLSKAAEIELSRDEDSVTCLAAGPRRGRSTLAFAGINSNLEARQKGKNEHFRIFSVDAPAARSGGGGADSKISELARASFFQPLQQTSTTSTSSPAAATPDLHTYQRLVRVSASIPDGQGSTLPQLGACATGLSEANSQIVVFDVTSAAPAAAAASRTKVSTAALVPKVRGRIDLAKEAVDLDVVQTGPDLFQVAYCTEHQLYLLDVPTAAGAGSSAGSSGRARKNTSTTPYLAYDIQQDESTAPVMRPVFRSIRYVTPRFLLAACNWPKREGAFLVALRLPDIPTAAEVEAAKADKADKNGPVSRPWTARITLNVGLPKLVVSQATGLAVRSLWPPPATPGGRHAHGTQFVVAVAGACSGPAGHTLSLYTAEYQTLAGGAIELLAKLHPFRTLRNVHGLLVTNLALSAPMAPTAPMTTTPASKSRSPGTPYVRLASVSVSNSVTVHYIPLRKLPVAAASSTAAAVAAAAAATATTSLSGKPAPRYIVALKSRPPTGTWFFIGVAIMVAVLALMCQGLLEIRGLSRPRVGARAVVPETWQAPLPARWAAVPADGHGDGGGTPLRPLEALLQDAVDDIGVASGKKVLVAGSPDSSTVAGAGVQVVAHDEAAHGPAVAWDELETAQKHAWLERLQQAGHWTEQMGESVLRGVLFSELAGVMGAMV